MARTPDEGLPPRTLTPSPVGEGSELTRSEFVQQAAEELADVLLLYRLCVDPVANLLLLGAHMADQGLNAFGERCDRLGVTLIFDRRLPALGNDRPLRHCFRDRRRLHVAGEKLLEFGIEPILRLPRLEIEKAEDERTRKPEQRGGERDAHARDRGRKAGLERVEHARRVDPGLHAVDDAGDRMHRLQEPPEGAEQPEEHQ